MQEPLAFKARKRLGVHREPLLHESHVDHGVAHEGLRLSFPVPGRVLVVCSDSMKHLGNILWTQQKQEESTQVTHALKTNCLKLAPCLETVSTAQW